jgi:hypothetical protein
MYFQNGEGVRVVRLGFSQTRGGTCESFIQPGSVTSTAGLSLSLCIWGATHLSKRCSKAHTFRGHVAELAVKCSYGFAFAASFRIIANRTPAWARRFSKTGVAAF